MARYQLTGHGWPIEGGAKLVPVGTILDTEDWTWNGTTLPWPPPVNAMALDQESYDELARHYDYFRILTAGDINRHADP